MEGEPARKKKKNLNVNADVMAIIGQCPEAVVSLGCSKILRIPSSLKRGL